MELTLENIEQHTEISQKEFGQLANWLYGSVSISRNESAVIYQKKEERLDFLLVFLQDYYEEHERELESDGSEGDFLDFYAKIKLQKELLQILSGKIKLKDIEMARQSFALKSKYPVGMR
jgi:hypothetical protein